MDGTGEPSAIRKIAWAVAAFVALAVLAWSVVVVVGAPRWLTGEPDCSVSVGSRTVDLSSREAESASSIAAGAVRRGQSLETTATALARRLDVPDEDARAVASALTGRSAHALTCQHGGADEAETNRLDRAGLTARAARVRSELERAFGSQQLGGFAPGGVTDGHMPGSAHYEGRAVDVFFRPVTRKQRVRGWSMAQYLVAQAERLEVTTVIFDGRIWTARRASQGWRSYQPDTSGRTARVAAVLEHRDHVHVDVAD